MKFTFLPLTSEPVHFPASPRAYIGDPCYVVPDEYWSDFCSAMFDAEAAHPDTHAWVVRIDGDIAGIVGSTRWGDGGYPYTFGDDASGVFDVDAGLFSILPLVEADASPILDAIRIACETHSTLIPLPSPVFTPNMETIDKGFLEGTFAGTRLRIDTAGEEDEEDEDFDDDDYFTDEDLHEEFDSETYQDED